MGVPLAAWAPTIAALGIAMDVTLDSRDDPPAEWVDIVDAGLTAYSDAAAPLHEVRAMACIARDARGQVVGGAVGRRWGSCCELQQLWVDEARRHAGLGTRLMRQFEADAVRHGCGLLYLETLSYQAPDFYRRLGYAVQLERRGFPQGIVKYHMGKTLPPAQG